MTLNISINVHAQDGDEAEFKLYRQDTTGSLVLKVEASGVYPSLALFLDDATLAQLRAAVNKPVTFTEAIRAAVAQRGRDHLYTGQDGRAPVRGSNCWYVHQKTGEAGCVIGLALNLLGITLEQLAENEGENADQLLSRLGIGTARERAAAIVAQGRQDGGATWGEALDTYDKLLAQL
jgi:hypothetical protein